MEPSSHVNLGEAGAGCTVLKDLLSSGHPIPVRDRVCVDWPEVDAEPGITPLPVFILFSCNHNVCGILAARWRTHNEDHFLKFLCLLTYGVPLAKGFGPLLPYNGVAMGGVNAAWPVRPIVPRQVSQREGKAMLVIPHHLPEGLLLCRRECRMVAPAPAVRVACEPCFWWQMLYAIGQGHEDLRSYGLHSLLWH